MPVETINVTFPSVVRSIFGAVDSPHNADPSETGKVRRAERARQTPPRRVPWHRIGGPGRPVRDIEDVYLRGVQNFGLPVDSAGGVVDLRVHIGSSYRFTCPMLVGPIEGETGKVVVELRSAEQIHPLEHSRVVREGDFVSLTLQDFANGGIPVQRTTFDFYPDHFDRTDTGDLDELRNTAVKRGDEAKLREFSGFLRRSYSKSGLVLAVQQNAVRINQRQHG